MAEAAVAWWEETQAWEDRTDLIAKEMQHLTMRMMDKDFLSGLSEAERAAKLEKAQEEKMRLVKMLNQEFNAPVKKPDFSCMTESERAAAAERLREKELERVLLLRAQGRPYADPEKIARSSIPSRGASTTTDIASSISKHSTSMRSVSCSPSIGSVLLLDC